MQTEMSFILLKSTTARSERPISRWISCVRPEGDLDSRGTRTRLARGSMPYSAVIQPLFWPFSQFGTFSSTLAVQTTWVLPNFTRQEPSA